jgi:2-oxoacid:acceptor oxidoreductase gamma subunit (pyruvate/2-ketoisovalerate family)
MHLGKPKNMAPYRETKMLEIKFHGRGGQGVVIASQMLGMAFFRKDMYPQCYSLFGGERRGAPVVSFLRVGTEKILLKCEIKNPNELIVFEPSLLDPQEVRSVMPLGSRILVNSRTKCDFLSELTDYRVGLVDAQSIADSLELGHVINTAILGAYCRFTGHIPIESFVETVRDMAPQRKEINAEAARQGYEKVTTINGNNP